MTDCPCLEAGPAEYGSKWLGVDPAGGAFAEVELRTCRRCARLWLHYRYEIEGFSRSGRWHAGIVTAEQANGLAPEEAPDLLASLPWFVCGGSYWGGRTHRTTGRLPG